MFTKKSNSDLPTLEKLDVEQFIKEVIRDHTPLLSEQKDLLYNYRIYLRDYRNYCHALKEYKNVSELFKPMQFLLMLVHFSLDEPSLSPPKAALIQSLDLALNEVKKVTDKENYDFRAEESEQHFGAEDDFYRNPILPDSNVLITDRNRFSYAARSRMVGSFVASHYDLVEYEIDNEREITHVQTTLQIQPHGFQNLALSPHYFIKHLNLAKNELEQQFNQHKNKREEIFQTMMSHGVTKDPYFLETHERLIRAIRKLHQSTLEVRQVAHSDEDNPNACKDIFKYIRGYVEDIHILHRNLQQLAEYLGEKLFKDNLQGLINSWNNLINNEYKALFDLTRFSSQVFDALALRTSQTERSLDNSIKSLTEILQNEQNEKEISDFNQIIAVLKTQKENLVSTTENNDERVIQRCINSKENPLIAALVCMLDKGTQNQLPRVLIPIIISYLPLLQYPLFYTANSGLVELSITTKDGILLTSFATEKTKKDFLEKLSQGVRQDPETSFVMQDETQFGFLLTNKSKHEYSALTRIKKSLVGNYNLQPHYFNFFDGTSRHAAKEFPENCFLELSNHEIKEDNIEVGNFKIKENTVDVELVPITTQQKPKFHPMVKTNLSKKLPDRTHHVTCRWLTNRCPTLFFNNKKITEAAYQQTNKLLHIFLSALTDYNEPKEVLSNIQKNGWDQEFAKWQQLIDPPKPTGLLSAIKKLF